MSKLVENSETEIRQLKLQIQELIQCNEKRFKESLGKADPSLGKGMFSSISLKGMIGKFQAGEDFTPDERMSFTVGEYWKQKTVIELSPKQYQRYFRADIDWQEQFMKSFFVSDIIIPEIALRFGTGIPVGLVETMDGCQRMSTLITFRENEVCLPNDDELEFVKVKGADYTFDLRGKTYTELPSVVKDSFDNYKLTSMVYYNLTAERAGIIFVEVLNNQNKLEAQEKRQAISSAMSRWVQETSRFNPIEVHDTKTVNGKTKQCKSVFQVIDGKPSTLKWLSKAEHTKLGADQCLAEIIYMISSDTWKSQGVTGAMVTKFYKIQAEKFQDEFNSNLIEQVLIFVNQSMRQVPKAKTLAFKPFRNYCVMYSEMYKAKVSVDPINFMICYLESIKNLSDKKLCAEGMSNTPYQSRMRGNGKEDTTTTIDMLWKEMAKVKYKSVQLDKTREFTREEVEKAYWKQKQICPICETEMPEFGPDIHGDHVLLYKDGNPTTSDNCDAVHASCNLRK